MSRGRFRAASMLVVAALWTGASAFVGCTVAAGPGYYGYDGDYPPDAYIATAEPVYFEGRATYWYGGRWYYRDGGSWRHYDREPPALYQRRVQAPPVRRSYDGFRGGPPARARGGWRRGR